MRTQRLDWDGQDAGALAARLRADVPVPEGLAEDVAAIIEDVRARGDEALRELTARFDAPDAGGASVRASGGEIESAAAGLQTELHEALDLAATNVRRVARAQLAEVPVEVEMPEGHTVSLEERPVASAGVYAPGGRAAYPSSVLMCCIPAAVAGVERIALASPPGPDGRLSPVVLAAAAIGGATEAYAVGGAQAIAALALGTETVAPVEVIAGPGNAWVTEAKRQLYGTVGIDGLAGPSELVVVADRSADARAVALGLLAQAEHGPESPLVAISPDEAVLGRIAELAAALAPERPSVADASLALVAVPSVEAALALSDALAPEHLELRFAGADAALARRRIAGCVFVGDGAVTAFGDYAAGSNHVLPTGGAARFGGPLGPRAFMRRTCVVSIPADAAAKLAPAVDRIAREEGLPVHGESARANAEKTADLQVD